MTKPSPQIQRGSTPKELWRERFDEKFGEVEFSALYKSGVKAFIAQTLADQRAELSKKTRRDIEKNL